MGNVLRMLDIEVPVVLAQTIGILLLIVLYRRFLHRPFRELLRKRQEAISGKISAAEELERKAGILRKDYEQRLAGISDEAKSRIDQAVKDAEAARSRLLESTQNEIRDLYRQHEKELAFERERARRKLRSEIMDLAVAAATKALRNQMTPASRPMASDRSRRSGTGSPECTVFRTPWPASSSSFQAACWGLPSILRKTAWVACFSVPIPKYTKAIPSKRPAV